MALHVMTLIPTYVSIISYIFVMFYYRGAPVFPSWTSGSAGEHGPHAFLTALSALVSNVEMTGLTSRVHVRCK